MPLIGVSEKQLVLYNIFIAIVNLPQNYFIHALSSQTHTGENKEELN